MKDIEDYLRKLAAKCPSVREVWLLGSRANNTERENSDWDLLAFADQSTFNTISEDESLHLSNVDLLVVHSENGTFEKPWGDKKKKGSLNSWSWVRTTDREATYESHRWIPDAEQKYPGTETGYCETLKLKALRIWPRE